MERHGVHQKEREKVRKVKARTGTGCKRATDRAMAVRGVGRQILGGPTARPSSNIKGRWMKTGRRKDFQHMYPNALSVASKQMTMI